MYSNAHDAGSQVLKRLIQRRTPGGAIDGSVTSCEGAAPNVIDGALVFVVFYALLRWAPDNSASLTFLVAEVVYLVAGSLLGGSPLGFTGAISPTA